MTDRVNTEEIVKTGPDLIGFIFYTRSKRFAGTNPESCLPYDIAPGILKAGVFVNEQLSVIPGIVNTFRLDMLQLNGNEPPEYCYYLKSHGFTIIIAFGLSNSFNFAVLDIFHNVCDYFLFDTKTGHFGGSGTKFNWSKINEYQGNKPFFLSGGIDPGDALIIKKLNHPCLFGVDINSRFETVPGIKDIKKVKDFIEKIKG